MLETLHSLLEHSRQRLWYRFRALRGLPAPEVNVPRSPDEALRLGYHMGLQAGYGKGLVDGVDLGLDVGAYPPNAHAGDSDFLS